MQPTFIQLPETKVIGLGAKFISILSPRKNNSVVIPALWEKFISRVNRMSGMSADPSYGLVEMLPESEKTDKDEMFYVAAVPVGDFDDAPPELIHRVIPAGKYASFTHTGKLHGLGKTMREIYFDWLPKSGITLRNAAHLELYDERFSPDSDRSEFDILLPV